MKATLALAMANAFACGLTLPSLFGAMSVGSTFWAMANVLIFVVNGFYAHRGFTQITETLNGTKTEPLN